MLIIGVFFNNSLNNFSSGVKGTWWEKADLTVSDVLMPRSPSIVTVVANQLVSIKGKCRTRVNTGTQPRLASVAPLVAHPFLDDHFFHGEVPFIAVLPVAKGNYQRRQVILLLDHHHHHLPSLGNHCSNFYMIKNEESFKKYNYKT